MCSARVIKKKRGNTSQRLGNARTRLRMGVLQLWGGTPACLSPGGLERAVPLEKMAAWNGGLFRAQISRNFPPWSWQPIRISMNKWHTMLGWAWGWTGVLGRVQKFTPNLSLHSSFLLIFVYLLLSSLLILSNSVSVPTTTPLWNRLTQDRLAVPLQSRDLNLSLADPSLALVHKTFGSSVICLLHLYTLYPPPKKRTQSS